MRFFDTIVIRVNFGDGAAGGVRLKSGNFALRQQRDVRMLEGRLNADHMRVGLCLDETRKAIAGRATDALALVRILFVEQDTNRQVKWPVAQSLQIVTQLLDPPLVTDGRNSIWFAGGRLCRIFAAAAMQLMQVLGLGVM